MEASGGLSDCYEGGMGFRTGGKWGSLRQSLPGCGVHLPVGETPGAAGGGFMTSKFPLEHLPLEDWS